MIPSGKRSLHEVNIKTLNMSGDTPGTFCLARIDQTLVIGYYFAIRSVCLPQSSDVSKIMLIHLMELAVHRAN